MQRLYTTYMSIIQDFAEIDDVYNSTLYIEGSEEPFHSSVGSPSRFELHQNEFKGKYNAYIELTFCSTFCSKTVNTSHFDFSELPTTPSNWVYDLFPCRDISCSGCPS